MTKKEPQKKQPENLLDQALEIFGKENVPKSNVQVCLRSLERISREKGLDYLKEHRQLIIDRVDLICNQHDTPIPPTYIPPSKR